MTKIIRNAYAMEHGYTVEFVATVNESNFIGVECLWSPELPPYQLRVEMAPQYRNTKLAFVEYCAELLGGTVTEIIVLG